MAERFDADPQRLREMRAEIDQVTAPTCAAARVAMLGIVKTASLAEALD